MIFIVIAFLWVSVLVYILMGGADFGAGIIELFTSKKNRIKIRTTAYKAIGPIWEANHMWLIIAIVILFVGFPVIYTTVSIYLHIPLLIMLLGIVARGTAFTFRNYDSIVDDWQLVYSRVFVSSSVVTPFFLGIIGGSTIAGEIDPEASGFMSSYIFSWLHGFSIAVGLFTTAICGFLASVYLIGEAGTESEKKLYVSKAKIMIISAWTCGVLVFIAAYFQNIPLTERLFGNKIGVLAIICSTVSVIFLWYKLHIGRTIVIRFLAVFQVAMIYLTITYGHYPGIVIFNQGETLSLFEAQGHEKTIISLGWALIIGAILILPALFYLVYSFEKKSIS